MCQRVRDGNIFFQPCDWGPIIGSLIYFDSRKSEMLYSCSGCGCRRIKNREMPLSELIFGEVKSNRNFGFQPNESLKKEDLDNLVEFLSQKGVDPSRYILGPSIGDIAFMLPPLETKTLYTYYFRVHRVAEYDMYVNYLFLTLIRKKQRFLFVPNERNENFCKEGLKSLIYCLATRGIRLSQYIPARVLRQKYLWEDIEKIFDSLFKQRINPLRVLPEELIYVDKKPGKGGLETIARTAAEKGLEQVNISQGTLVS